MVWVGPGTSSFGYLTSAQNLESPLNNKAAKYNTQDGDSKSNKLEDDGGEDRGEETKEENEAETSYFWIRYQEGRPSEYFSSLGQRLLERTSVPSKRVKYAYHSQQLRHQDMVHKSGDAESEEPFVHLKPKEVLQHMLGCVEDYHSEVYRSDLRCYKESQVDFMEFLLPEARQVLECGDYSLANLLSIGAKNPGRDRGIDHENFKVDEVFVFLAEVDSDDPNLLNLLEMWCSLMLQTLTKNALLKYLPENGVAPYAGNISTWRCLFTNGPTKSRFSLKIHPSFIRSIL
ncbi:hypothetical protein K432DRAFT_391506 [Lepidopterella palustris CBS 459.81]|uniref:Uncharacterized protein n=1 Tax=Lepidopterella palustris CBS 459.81 TaxID=1314670 RepID=A0A8E2JH50_9PEZI|nr:hypothetical protein K432DRAFT_391506 [Lepidopterella palustris CBS 459.81]